MRFNQPILTLITSLFLVAAFIIAINLVTGNRVTADNSSVTRAVLQDVNGKRNSIDDEDEDEGEEPFEEEEQEEDDFGGREDDEDEDGEDEDEEDYEEDEEEEEHFHEMELERMEIEANIGRLESIDRLAEIASNDTAMASYAIMQMEEFVEDEDEAIELLEELVESDKVTKPVRNLLKMKLAEVYLWQDRRNDTLKLFRSMIESK